MTIGIAADHGGFHLKEKLKSYFKEYSFCDFGALFYDANDDYPDLIYPLAQAMAANTVNRGIALCGSGVGACMVANKVQGVRAALINETYSAHQGVEHDNMNLICMGARVVGESYAIEIVSHFLSAQYTGEERHQRRLDKLKRIEKKHLRRDLP